MLGPLFKKRIQHRCVPVIIAKLFRTAFFMEHYFLWLLLSVWHPKFEMMQILTHISTEFKLQFKKLTLRSIVVKPFLSHSIK